MSQYKRKDLSPDFTFDILFENFDHIIRRESRIPQIKKSLTLSIFIVSYFNAKRERKTLHNNRF